MSFVGSTALFSRREFLRRSGPLASLATMLATALDASRTVPEVVLRIEEYHRARAALDDAYATGCEDDDWLDTFRDPFFQAREALICCLLGNPAPDACHRHWPGRGTVHDGMLYLAIPVDEDDHEMYRPGEYNRFGNHYMMELRIFPLDALEGIAGQIPRRPSPFPRPEHPEMVAAAREFRAATDRLRALQGEYDFVTRLGVVEIIERFERAKWTPAESRAERAEAELVRIMRAEGVGAVSAGGRLFADQVADAAVTQGYLPRWIVSIDAGRTLHLD